MNLQRKRNVSKILGVLSLIFLVVSVLTILVGWNIGITQDVRIAVWLYSGVISFLLAIISVLFHRSKSSWITLECSGIACIIFILMLMSMLGIFKGETYGRMH